MTGEEENSSGIRLNALLEQAGLASVDPEETRQFEKLLSLFVRWNSRLNLSSVRSEEAILSRHFVESIACARALPNGIATLLDFGSGGGFPGIPIALCRREVAVTLAESQGKKAAFLQEAVRVLGISAKVHAQRAELLEARFDCVTLRAVDRMAEAVEASSRLVAPRGWLGLMTTRASLARLQAAAGVQFSWTRIVQLPGGVERVLALGRQGVSLPV